MAKKLKGKGWYNIVAPKNFRSKDLGKTPAGDPSTLIGRKVDVSVINLLNDPNKYYFKFKFKIVNLDGTKALTEFNGLVCLRDYISRMVRHGVTRLDTVQDLETADKKKIRVKTITLISRKSRKDIEVLMRRFIKEKVKENVESMKMNDFLEKVLNDSLKREIKEKGGKIYPIRAFEIRKIEVLN
jgi:small subunit ribosomal protein S3Ae